MQKAGRVMFMYCADCGQKVAPGAKFCEDCGAAIGQAGSAAPPRPPARPFQVQPAPSPGKTGARKKAVWIAFAAMILVAIQLISLFSGQDSNTPFLQWLAKANPFYQQYFTVINDFEAVNQNRQATRQQVIQSWEKLGQDLRALQGQLSSLKPLAGVSKEDEADMVQLHAIWSEVVAVELKITEQMVQFSRSGQRPPAQFLRTTLPGLWQTKNKLMQDQQTVLTRLFSRHQISTFSPGASR